jgi:dihydrofolate synthase/folylpolyglutamate synthase
MRRLREALGKSFKYEKLVVIIGACADKDVKGMVEELASVADTVVVTRSRHPRALDPEKLAAEFNTYRIPAKVEGSVPDAIKYALTVAESRDLIVATGSLFVVGEVIAHMNGVPLE